MRPIRAPLKPSRLNSRRLFFLPARGTSAGKLAGSHAQFRPEEVHQQAVVEPAIPAALILAQHAHPAEADLLVAADSPLIGGRWIDGQPVVPALLAQEPGQQGHRLGAEALTLAAGAQ